MLYLEAGSSAFWSDWGEWSECSKTCYFGKRRGSRSCIDKLSEEVVEKSRCLRDKLPEKYWNEVLNIDGELEKTYGISLYKDEECNTNVNCCKF